MGTISLQTPTVGQLNSTEDPKITSDFNVLQTLVNGNIDTNNLKSTTAGITRRQLALGASYPNNIQSASTTQSPQYGTMIVAQATLTVNLPTAAAGGLIGVLNVNSTSTVTIAAPGGAMILVPNGTYVSSTTMTGRTGDCVVLMSDGLNWFFASRNTNPVGGG